jgi:acyl carrier protein
MGLEIVELVLAVEERFGIEVDDIDAEKVETVGQLHSLVLKRMQRTTATAPSATEAWTTLCDLIEERTGVPRSKIKPEARLVDDLGLD